MNDFFSQQCQPISDESILSLIPTYYTDNRLNDVNVNYEKILKVIHSLDPNKTHGHDGVSVRMLKLSPPSFANPLLIIFRNCLKFGTFPDDWKKGNVPVHKEDNKQIANNYLPVSLLLICSKVPEKLIFDTTFESMIENNLLSSTQSGFKRFLY